jgi:hypothetical protein
MCKYHDANLVKYADTIRLHFDTTGTLAWLTLKNYGVVFHRWEWAKDQKEWEKVKEITIGVSIEERTMQQCHDFASIEGRTYYQVLGLIADKDTIAVGSMLDVLQVIRLQVKLLESARCHSLEGETWEGNQRSHPDKRSILSVDQVMEQLEAAKDPTLGPRRKKEPSPANRLKPVERMSRRLHSMLRREDSAPPPPLPPPRPRISGQIRANREPTIGFTAYFPNPSLIIEEQRTAFSKQGGKTINEDTRSLKAIPSPTRDSDPKPKSGRKAKDVPRAFQEFLDELDKMREADEEGFTKTRDLIAQDRFDNVSAYLHRHLERRDRYGFRGGEIRDLASMKAANGLMPGVTRKDEGVSKYKALGERIDDAIKAGGEEYRKVMAELDVLTLGVYTAKQEFKGYLSVSTSVAIAKRFANYYSETDSGWSYGYAVRCKGSFHLPTPAKREGVKWDKKQDAQFALVHFAEQEIAVPGGIGWDHVVGMRVIEYDLTGQYFSGPVFMNDRLRKEYLDTVPKELKVGDIVRPLLYGQQDNGAFDELFELLSGRSQGQGDTICWSYEDAPFDCPDSLMVQRSLRNSNGNLPSTKSKRGRR